MSVPSQDSSAADLSTLLKFLNAAPLGLVQFGTDGEVELMNALAARLLIPLQPQGPMDNLYRLLHDRLPGLRQRVDAFDGMHGTVCEGLQLDVSDRAASPRDPQHLSLSISKLDSRRLMAVVGDVTQQVRTQQALANSELQLQMAMSAARIGMWQLDLSSGEVLRSNLDERIFGGRPRLPLHTLENFLRQVHADDLGTVSHTLQQAIAVGEDWRAEFRVLWDDDSVHWVAAHGHVQHDGGRARRMLCILVDTTAQRNADAQRQQARELQAENEKVRETSRMKSQFLANMSHELRTPLNAIIGFSELLHRGLVPPGSPKQAQYLQHISRSGHHLLQLINDVLDIAKVESGKFEFMPVWLDLAALVAEVLATLQPGMQARRLRPAVYVAPQLTRVHLDPVRLKQVLFNYLSNAIKFAPESGQVALRVLESDPHHLRIEVEDNGPGIAPGEIDQLFVDFHQLESSRGKGAGGTGLGLALTRKLVQAQGGEVGVSSTPWVSTVFHAVLNREDGWDAQQAQARRVAAEAAAGPARLLVIEPDVQLQQALILGMGMGQQTGDSCVDVASTGQQAQQRAAEVAYRGITLDMVLPDQSGLITLQRIRDGGPSRGAPVLGVSMPAVDGSAACFAITDILGKPIRVEEVRAAMTSLSLPAGRPARVLVLDADPVARELMRVTLAGLGHDAELQSAGMAALQSIALQPPDALVLDLAMPGMNGLDVLAALRRLPQGRQLPVFVWTRMLLSEQDYAELAGSARAIINQGGGDVADLVAGLQQWQQAALQRETS